MDRNVLSCHLASENLAIVSPAPPRFTIDDYVLDARQKNRISQDQQMLADRVLAYVLRYGFCLFQLALQQFSTSLCSESERIIDETRSSTEKCKLESDYRMRERLDDIRFLLDETKRQKKIGCQEEEALKTYRQRLLNAIKFIKEMGVTICQKCIIMRESRRGVDMFNDEVDQELKHEIHVIYSCQEMLDRALSETSEQIRRLRATIYLLDRDLSNKGKSLGIDEVNLSLRPNQQHLSVYEGATPLDPLYVYSAYGGNKYNTMLIILICSNTTNEEWIQVTRIAIQNTAKELNSAEPLRSYIDIILAQMVDDLTNQVGRTNEALAKRISETRYAKTVLEGIHNQTALKVNDMSQCIVKLEQELNDKQGYVALCQMRLANRAQRPGVELCQDQAQAALLAELQTLRQTVGTLSQALAQSRATMRYLQHTQMTQEEEINVKTNSLKIDEVDCMTLRQGLNFTTF